MASAASGVASQLGDDVEAAVSQDRQDAAEGADVASGVGCVDYRHGAVQPPKRAPHGVGVRRLARGPDFEPIVDARHPPDQIERQILIVEMQHEGAAQGRHRLGPSAAIWRT